MLKRSLIIWTALVLLFSALIAYAQPTSPPRMMLPVGTIQGHPLLDSAFEMLEEGNIFVERYNKLAHRHVVVRYQLGVPYFFGGKLERLIGRPRSAWQDSKFFVNGRIYVYGFDCHGLTQWIYKSNGWRHPEKISDTFKDRGNEHTRIPLMDVPFDMWRSVLPIGALLSLQGKSGNHIMMYVGTLENYGFTAEEVGSALAPYLHYPLFIQSGNSAAAIHRNERYIEGLNRPWTVYDTDGGVNVCLVGAPQSAAPLSEEAGNLDTRFFDLCGQELLAYDQTEKAAYYGWYPDTAPIQLKNPKVANAKTIPAPTASQPAQAQKAKAQKPAVAKAAATPAPGTYVYNTDVQTLPSGPVKSHPLLDSAFEMLEEGNVFLTRYNELTHQKVVARFSLGVPNFIDGNAQRYLLTPRTADRDNRFFQKGRLYVSGLDNFTFTQWVYQQNGWKHFKSIRTMLDTKLNKDSHIHLKDLPYDEWRNVLPIGALMAMDEDYALHVMMYIGTLENYGFSEGSLPENMRPYLHYPLFIHCGLSPAAVERNKQYIKSLNRRWKIYDTNGGVSVCMVGVPDSAAPVVGQIGKKDIHGFDGIGQELSILTPGEKATFYGWYPDTAPQPLKKPKQVNTVTIVSPEATPSRAPEAETTTAPAQSTSPEAEATPTASWGQ